MLDSAKIVDTFDSSGKKNGWLMELKTSGRKTDSYLTAVLPGAFKGYHLHRVRESNYVCIKGIIKVITFSIEGRQEFTLYPGDKLNIPINTPTGIQNDFKDEAWLINFPDPAYDPLLTDEQIDFTEEEVLKWLNELRVQNAQTF